MPSQIVQAYNPGVPMKRDWRAALAALRRLLANGDDTAQVFYIMRALNGEGTARNYRKLLTVPGGGAIAYRRTELSTLLSDRDWIAGFAEGSVGAHYRHFLESTGYSAQGLIDVGTAAIGSDLLEAEHPYAWMGRRERDIHDLWHVLTGYQADEHLGEACLVAFSYAQTGGLGWALIAAGAGLKSVRVTRRADFLKAVREGYRRGRRAAWLHGEDYAALLAEPLDAARARLGITDPVRYRIAQASLAQQGLSGI